jgi:hypothetical protein
VDSVLVSALSILGEYLAVEYFTPLLSAYGLTAADLRPQVKAASTEVEMVGADSNTERVGGGGFVKEKKKVVPTAVKKLQQVDTRKMPSLASMWGKKKT